MNLKRMHARQLTYSVIIPALNEAERIVQTIRSLCAEMGAAETIVVDGGSSDETAALSRREGARVLAAHRGRGIQCNAGARAAAGEILIFLHSDTRLPHGALELLNQYFAHPQVQIGTFRLQFDHPHWLLRFYAAFTRFDSIFTRFGDQAIVVRKSFFQKIGGFPDWPLLEDVHLLRRARRVTKIHSFPARVVTSARRFLKMGIVRCQLLNGWLILQYLLGRSPAQLAAQYRDYQNSRGRRPKILRSRRFEVEDV
jgi:rSAM/selenodomain-associated transferase 2